MMQTSDVRYTLDVSFVKISKIGDENVELNRPIRFGLSQIIIVDFSSFLASIGCQWDVPTKCKSASKG